ncbi:MAG TPA: DNA polymerase III subunit gamma/tau [Bacteroidales bacterium]|nr:DNA polymerase III subunit gamma/tau [Bacteroidales bacterium]HPR72396.1 DNA polymerase III subunit gamma/tau [Bacteroidales bacterium]
MENFIVSARKYRPATFDMVVGQEAITNTLKNAIKCNHLAQAYLFCGPRGVGKTTCARIFAKTINCFNLDENANPCNKCESCISFNTLRSFNIHELDAASNNKVEDIRSLNEQVRIPPQIGKYSVYIIDEVHMLSSSAFNAFLKTLEEPPPHAIFILATTEKHKIIPTILSRCQIFDFNRIKIEDIVKRLSFVAKNESVEAEEEALHIIAQKADGALRDALSIFDQMVSLCGKKVTYKDVIENLNVLDYDYYFKIIDGVLKNDLSSVLITFNEILESGFDAHNFISGLNSHLRDLLVSRDQVTLRLLETTPSVRQKYARQAAECTEDFLYKALETGSNCDISYRNSKNTRLHVELALIKLCNILSDKAEETQKKKSDGYITQKPADEIPVPSKSEIIRQDNKDDSINTGQEKIQKSKHIPVTEKEIRSFSVKEIFSENENSSSENKKPRTVDQEEDSTVVDAEKMEFNENSFTEAWTDFVDDLRDEGPRILSMFKSVRPEFDDNQVIKIHLSNLAQKDIFIQDYKQKLINFLLNRFSLDQVNIETFVDTSETEEILYTDEQKYNYLQSKYPLLKEFKKSFNLDIT